MHYPSRVPLPSDSRTRATPHKLGGLLWRLKTPLMFRARAAAATSRCIFAVRATRRRVPRSVRGLTFLTVSIVKVMSAPTVDRARLVRLFAFIREHLDQARMAEDEVRVWKWERILNILCDRLPRG
jgi:hypothetical protein